MRRFLIVCAVLASLALPRGGTAQTADDAIVVTIIPLRFLDPNLAIELAKPYLEIPSAVLQPAGNQRGITLRESVRITRKIQAMLLEQDHAKASIILRFQLIKTSDSTITGPNLGDVLPTLKSLLRFSGYRLAGQALTVVDENENYRVGLPGRLSVSGDVVAIDPKDGRVQLHVSLTGDSFPDRSSAARETLISTGLTVPMGQTVVLGTSSADGATYVLTVRPEKSATKP